MTLIRTKAAYIENDAVKTLKDSDNQPGQASMEIKSNNKKGPVGFDARPLMDHASLRGFDFGTVRLDSVHVCMRFNPQKSNVYESLVSIRLP